MATGGVAYFEIVQDFFFILDVFLSFNTGIFENGTLIMLRAPITISYIKLWFWIDLIASFPYSLVLSPEDYFNVSPNKIDDSNTGVIKIDYKNIL